jgi:predicted O-linked N-acetylglucosamine transferase (SPINDLY family)
MSNNIGLRAFHNARAKKRQAKALDAGAAYAQAVALNQAGRLGEAQALCREILGVAPRHFDTLHLLGVIEYQNGRHEEADALLERALAVDPRSAAAWSNRGIVLQERKRFADALGCYDQALALRPHYPEALSNRGNALVALERFEEAIADYDRALALRPSYAEGWSNRGNALTELRHFDEALASCDRALALRPGYADALSNRGNALTELGRFDEALASYDKALANKPGLSAAWVGRGNVLLNLNRYAEAHAAFEQALAINPDNLKALAQLAHGFERQGRVEDAIGCYDRVLSVRPDFATIISNKIFALDFAPGVGFVEQQEARREWWRQVGSKIAAQAPPQHDNDRDPARRIVLGYVSSDFRRHSAAATFRPVLRHHDRTRFEIVCYSCSTVADDVTADFRQIADRWIEAAQLSDQALAERIRADRIDILIDLSGHSAGNRLGVFARKPAPVQVTAWGHVTGTGLQTMDYIFADPVSIPQIVRPLFAERVYDLPCLITIEPPPCTVLIADPPVLATGSVTFGCFNRISKVSNAAIALWSRILIAAPRSRLLLKDTGLDDPLLRALLAEKFGRHGIAADRLGFMGRTSREEHLATFKDVDISLDPFPQNGGVSTWEALYCGVPAVALLGNNASSRLAAAILSSVGLPEWVAADEDEYVSIALDWAAKPDELKALRHALPDRIAASAAGNAVAYTRAVEAGYRRMWEDRCRMSDDRGQMSGVRNADSSSDI